MPRYSTRSGRTGAQQQKKWRCSRPLLRVEPEPNREKAEVFLSFAIGAKTLFVSLSRWVATPVRYS